MGPTKPQVSFRRPGPRETPRGWAIFGARKGYLGALPSPSLRRLLSLIELERQYRFATPNSLKPRPGLEGCKTASLCNASR